MITWAERISNLTKALGRKPTLSEMLAHQVARDFLAQHDLKE